MATYSDHSASSNIGMLKIEATNVPGRNTMVRAAMVFIAAPSALVSSAIAVLVLASCCVTRLKTFESLVGDVLIDYLRGRLTRFIVASLRAL